MEREALSCGERGWVSSPAQGLWPLSCWELNLSQKYAAGWSRTALALPKSGIQPPFILGSASLQYRSTGSSHHTCSSSQQEGKEKGKEKQAATLYKDTSFKVHMMLWLPGLGPYLKSVGTSS